MREKSLSFIQLTVAEAFVKSSLETYVLQRLQGQFSVFHFLILFWKALKFAKFFLIIRNNVPDNCINIGYNFGPVKCRPNKRSGKLRIKSQFVWVRFFLCISIADYRQRQPVTYFIHFFGETLSTFIVNRDRNIFF